MPALPTLVLALCLTPAATLGDDPPAAVEIIAIHPDRQLGALLALFEGTSVRDPAELLAAYRRASRNPEVLSKAAQAAITALNRDMVVELARLHGATFRLWSLGDGEPVWSFRIEDDDGTFADLATALALTDGRAEAPLDDASIAVDRLDPNGSILSAARGETLVVSNDRETLRRAIYGPSPTTSVPHLCDVDCGWRLTVMPAALRTTTDPLLARLRGILDAASIGRLDADVALVDDTLTVQALAQLPPRQGSPTLAPAWIAALPASESAAFALTLSPGDGNLEIWSSTIDLLVPSEAKPRAASRTRLNTLALLAGVSTEVELWPRLRGVSGFLDRDTETARPRGGVLILHARDQHAAARLAARVIPRLAAVIGVVAPNTSDRDPQDFPQRAVSLGDLEGRPLLLLSRGADLLLAWGRDPLNRALEAQADPVRSLARSPALQDFDPTEADHLIVLRPAPLATSGRNDPIAAALRDAPPLVLIGRRGEEGLSVRATWPGLRQTVQRLIDATPRETRAPEPSP